MPFQTETERQAGQEKTTASVYICAIQTIIKSHFLESPAWGQIVGTVGQRQANVKVGMDQIQTAWSECHCREGQDHSRHTLLTYTNCALTSAL